MSNTLEQLKTRLNDVAYLGSAAALVSWEQQTYMPEGGAETRAGQLSTLARIEHEMFTSDETGRLLQDAAQELNGAGPDSADARLIKVTQRDYDLRTKIPAALVAEINHHGAIAHNIWAKARANNDYKSFAPALQKTFDLMKQVAEHLGYADHIYDALLDQYEPGMKTADVAAMFAGLKTDLVPLVAAIKQRQDRVDDTVLHRDYDVQKQNAFSEMVAKDFGFDFHRGRQDKAVHPFCQSLSPDDVRITTRFDPKFLNTALFGTMHETGHALYEQGAGGGKLHLRMSSGTSLGVHESQSRLWENIVGRSRGFWKKYFPLLQQTFPESLGDVDLETFYRAINKSYPSFIRVEADEVTYNLHIMVRFEMETALLTGQLTVEQAPEAWNAKYQDYLGITPETDRIGILQDIHWSSGLVGYFPTYSIGNLLSAQLWEKATADQPQIKTDVENAKFDTLLAWLRENIHQHGRNFLPKELIQRVTGKPLSSEAYIRYLKGKYGEIYGF
jgi:carboxypeptidase Taq